MRTLSSSEFRRTFHQLIEPVTVTVLGRPIGSYTPITVPLSIKIDNGVVTIDPPPAKGRKVNLTVAVPDLGDVQMRPGGVDPKIEQGRTLIDRIKPLISPEFRPVPKPTRKKR